MAWNCVLELDAKQNCVAGKPEDLCREIGKGADLRIHTDFRHNEHIDTSSSNNEMVNEVSEFHETSLIDRRWTAGFMTTRQPVSLPDGFGSPPSMSFFMYNQDGRQAIARPHLVQGAASIDPVNKNQEKASPMPKYHQHNVWDEKSNAPSSNFIYDFDIIKYFVRNDWQEVFSHDENGVVASGSTGILTDAFLSGCEIKVGITGLFDDLAESPSEVIRNEVFIQIGWSYYYTEQKLFIAATHPLIRVKPAVPLIYTPRGWDFGWLIVRTDGFATKRICDPYTLSFTDSNDRYALRWFVR